MNPTKKWVVALAGFLFALPGRGADIIIECPQGMHVKSAEAKPLKMKLVAPGAVDGASVRFKDLLPDVAYDVKLTLDDGAILQGVNLGWYDMEPAKPDAGDVTDDDRQQITAIVKQILSFFNKNDIVVMNADHDRGTALVQLVRDNGFHSDSGDEVIWRMELWYFKNQHGGWEKVQQAAEVLQRERFKTRKEYEQTINHLRWTPELGGLKVGKKGPDVTITLPANAGTLGPSSRGVSEKEKAPEAK